jgi:hypothetical protein
MVRLVLSRAGVAVAAAVVTIATGSAARPAAAAERLPVVAAFSPLAEAAHVVGGADVRVTNLTPPGAEPHDLELSTDDRDAIADAGVVVVMGDGFQPAVEGRGRRSRRAHRARARRDRRPPLRRGARPARVARSRPDAARRDGRRARAREGRTGERASVSPVVPTRTAPS